MNTPVRRYIFVDFDTLTRIKFKKIEKICDKVFVFIQEEVSMIPFALVKDMQKMGSAVKWVPLATADLVHPDDLNYHICFFMGKLHEKVAGDIEFAVLSNDMSLDPLVRFINGSGRNCLRVKPNITLDNAQTEIPQRLKKTQTEEDDIDEMEPAEPLNHHPKDLEINGLVTGSLIDDTARETIRRLIRSGTRPTEVDDLKKYILLNNQEIGMNGNLEKIIRRLESSGDIVLSETEVVYNF